jgi:carbon-monoxide dehydrogenase medium subunit
MDHGSRGGPEVIPAQFDYAAPTSLAEALALLSEHKDDAKVLAGGHSLIPAMKLRLAQPQLLVDIGRIRELSYIAAENGTIRIGALATHHDIEASSVLAERCPLLPETAAAIGDVQVRNKGTIGGSVVHADPAADWPAAIVALDGEMVLASPRGERTVTAADFFVDMLTTSLEPDEILREIRIKTPTGRVGQAYLKVRQPASGFAVVGVAVSVAASDDGTCNSAAIGITGVASKAYRASGVESALVGHALMGNGSATSASAHAADGVDANGDLYASADYRKHLAKVYTRRAIELAASRIA